MEKTTIQISSNLLERLKMFKRHNRESYEEKLKAIEDALSRIEEVSKNATAQAA